MIHHVVAAGSPGDAPVIFIASPGRNTEVVISTTRSAGYRDVPIWILCAVRLRDETLDDETEWI
jgi:hypothetical protein